MNILVLFLAKDYNPTLMTSVYASTFSLLFGIVFTFGLPRLLDKKMEESSSLCILISAIGSVYMLVEIIASSVIISDSWKNGPKFIAGLIMLCGFILFWIGTIYLYYYVLKKNSREVLLREITVEEIRNQFLNDKVFGGTIALYSSYSALLFGLTPVIGAAMLDFHNDNALLGPLYILMILVFPWFVGWYVSITLPRRYFLAKTQKLVSQHNMRIEKDLRKN